MFYDIMRTNIKPCGEKFAATIVRSYATEQDAHHALHGMSVALGGEVYLTTRTSGYLIDAEPLSYVLEVVEVH
jgi:hypothetical protein